MKKILLILLLSLNIPTIIQAEHTVYGCSDNSQCPGTFSFCIGASGKELGECLILF